MEREPMIDWQRRVGISVNYDFTEILKEFISDNAQASLNSCVKKKQGAACSSDGYMFIPTMASLCRGLSR